MTPFAQAIATEGEMRDFVSEWRQQGQLFVWRYRQPRQAYRGWHFTGDPAGCRSMRNLIDRMVGGAPCHRTLELARVTQAVHEVPGFLGPIDRHHPRLRVEYRPDATELRLEVEGDRLTMAAGGPAFSKLGAAFASVEIGGGDLGMRPSDDRKADPWWFWWMPRTDPAITYDKRTR